MVSGGCWRLTGLTTCYNYGFNGQRNPGDSPVENAGFLHPTIYRFSTIPNWRRISQDHPQYPRWILKPYKWCGFTFLCCIIPKLHIHLVSENGIPPIPSWIIAIFPLDMMILRYTPFSDKPKWLEKSWEIPIFPNMFYPKPHGSLCFMVYIICRSTHIIFSCKFHCIFMISLGPQLRPPGKMLEKTQASSFYPP